MVKIGLSSRGEGVETADLTAESTPLIACCKRPCEGPAMKNATMAAPEYNIVTLLGAFKRPVGTLVLLVKGVRKSIHSGQEAYMGGLDGAIMGMGG